MSVAALNCPNCGAGAASDSSICEFCRTRLKTMACAHCLGLMFVGTKHCGHCGRKVIAANESNDSPPGECPRCKISLVPIVISEAKLSECHKCGGFWMSAEAFEELCTDRDEQSAVLGYRRADAAGLSAMPPKITYVPCPVCSHLMNRSNFARASGVIIDTCKSHGVWFDADELPRIIEFIRSGGLSVARQRELRDIQDQKEKLRDEARASQLMSRRFGPERNYADDGSGLKGFLRKLFE